MKLPQSSSCVAWSVLGSAHCAPMSALAQRYGPECGTTLQHVGGHAPLDMTHGVLSSASTVLG